MITRTFKNMSTKVGAVTTSAVLAASLLPGIAFANGADIIEAEEAEQLDAVELLAETGTQVNMSSTSTYEITTAGTYTFTGTCADGSISVAKGVTGVTIVLNNLNLTGTTTAPIVVGKNAEVTIQVTGTNTLTDNETDESAAIKAKSGSKVTITGNGTLNVKGIAKNGIKGASEATITIAGDSLKLNVDAAYNGIASDGELIIEGGTIDVVAGNDGIKSAPDRYLEDDAGDYYVDAEGNNIVSTDVESGQRTYSLAENDTKSLGHLTITGGTITVSAADDAIKASDVITIGTKGATSGPSVTVAKSNEGIEAAVINIYSGTVNVTSDDDGINAAYKGYSLDANKTYAKSVGSYPFQLNIAGGTVVVDANGDGLDSNGTITVTGGDTQIFSTTSGANNAWDWGEEDGYSFTYTGGTIIGIGNGSMQNGINSGTYVAWGINAGGGFGGGMGGFGGGPAGQQGARPELPSDTQGTQGGQGGFGGRSDMGQMPNDATSASGVSIAAGDTVAIKDASGTIIYSATAKKAANSVIFCSDALTEGSSYTLSINGTEAGSATATAGSANNGGGMQPGGQDGQGGVMGYSDVARTDWYAQAVETMEREGMMSGWDQNGSKVFSPTSSLTRAQAITIIYRNVNGTTSNETYGTNTTNFTDVAVSTWYTNALNWATKEGIVEGYTDTKTGKLVYGVNDPVTAEQLLKMIAEATDATLSADASTYANYPDAAKVSQWAQRYVAWGVANKLIGNSTNLDPQGSLERGRAAQIFTNALSAGLLQSNAQFPGMPGDGTQPPALPDGQLPSNGTQPPAMPGQQQ